jgi:hypothetical protein
MCKEIAKEIGFDFDRGRMDVSVHPFTGGSHPSDVRITTRYSVCARGMADACPCACDMLHVPVICACDMLHVPVICYMCL